MKATIEWITALPSRVLVMLFNAFLGALVFIAVILGLGKAPVDPYVIALAAGGIVVGVILFGSNAMKARIEAAVRHYVVCILHLVVVTCAGTALAFLFPPDPSGIELVPMLAGFAAAAFWCARILLSPKSPDSSAYHPQGFAYAYATAYPPAGVRPSARGRHRRSDVTSTIAAAAFSEWDDDDHLESDVLLTNSTWPPDVTNCDLSQPIVHTDWPHWNDPMDSSVGSHCDGGINPATGLPMFDCGGVDVGGSPFGTDIHEVDDHLGHNSMDSSWDDSTIDHHSTDSFDSISGLGTE